MSSLHDNKEISAAASQLTVGYRQARANVETFVLKLETCFSFLGRRSGASPKSTPPAFAETKDTISFGPLISQCFLICCFALGQVG